MDTKTVSHNSGKITSRDAARDAGERLYFPEVRCKRGHLDYRSVATDKCKTCEKEYRKRQKLYGPRCSVVGCNRVHDSDGYCGSHKFRANKHGDPLGGRVPNGTAAQWILDHVSYQKDECLIWPFSTDQNGYGIIHRNGKRTKAHIVMCEFTNGPKPEKSYHAAHSCGKGHMACVSPLHLRWATASENNLDKILHGTDNRGEKNPLSKLKTDDVLKIKSMLHEKTDRQIGSMFGVHRATIWDIRTGKTWRCVG